MSGQALNVVIPLYLRRPRLLLCSLQTFKFQIAYYGTMFMFCCIAIIVVGSLFLKHRKNREEIGNFAKVTEEEFRQKGIMYTTAGGIGILTVLFGYIQLFSSECRRKFMIFYCVIDLLLWASFFVFIVISIKTIVDVSSGEKRYRENLQLHLNQYGKQKNSTKFWNNLQQTNHCCGILSYKDWNNNSHFRTRGFTIPESCCKEGANKILCMHSNEDTYYQKGCLVDITKDYITPDNLHAYILIILSYTLIYLNENIAIVLNGINGCFHP